MYTGAYTCAVDVFSLAATAFELVTGVPCFWRQEDLATGVPREVGEAQMLERLFAGQDSVEWGSDVWEGDAGHDCKCIVIL
jgi:hypothetical protein